MAVTFKPKTDKKEYLKNWRLIHPDYDKNYNQVNRLRRIKNNRNLKLEAIYVLSLGTNKCMWEGCTEDRIDGLTIQHKHSGGGKHKKEINGHLYFWLKKNNYPTDDYEIYCANHQHEFKLIYGESKHNKNPTSEQLKEREYQQKYKDQLRWETFVAYSNSLIPFCIKCCTTNVYHLCLDHTHGDGAEDRKEMGDGTALYSKLRKLGYPDKNKYQVMCHTCNLIKKIEKGE